MTKLPPGRGKKITPAATTAAPTRLRVSMQLEAVSVGAKPPVLMVQERQKQFEAGEDWALLDALDLCMRTGTPIPLWIANAFGERYLDWLAFRAKSLDSAFRVKREKGTRVSHRANRERLKPHVVRRVQQLHAEGKGMPIDTALFERVGEDLNISEGLARSIYYDAKQLRGFLAALKKISK
jgi:hypothetical protein